MLTLACFRASAVALQAGGGVAPVIEHFLPLAHITKVAIVQKVNGNGQAACNSCGKLLYMHLQAAVASYGKNVRIWPAKLCANSSRQAIAHGAHAARCEHKAVFVQL